MKKKVIKIFAGAGVLLFFLTGCGSSASFSEEQTTQMAEYMAKKLLDHDKHYEEKLLPSETPEETAGPTETVPDTTPTPVPEEESTPEPKTPEQSGKKEEKSQGSLSEVLGCEGIKLQYKSHEICQTYPKNGINSYFIVEAGALHKLVVVKFSLKNTTDKQIKLDTTNKTISYSLEVGEDSVKPSMTLLSNDLQYLTESVSAGRSIDAVLVFEVPSDTKCKNLKLFAENGTKSAQQLLP